VPVEIIREIEVVKQIDMSTLQAMLAQMGTVELSRTDMGETSRTDKGEISRTDMGIVGNTSTKRDDLTKIEGIGPKIQELIYAEGIYTWKQLAATKSNVIQAILDKAGKKFQVHDPKTWSMQAAMAAKGDWDALKQWQDELDGGK
jgi:predicted flap endonuclease-1-like 5' DNA nuclease